MYILRLLELPWKQKWNVERMLSFFSERFFLHSQGLYGSPVLQQTTSFNFFELTLQFELRYNKYIFPSLLSCKKFGFLFPTRKFSSSIYLYTFYISQIKCFTEYYSQIRGKHYHKIKLSLLDSETSYYAWEQSSSFCQTPVLMSQASSYRSMSIL